ncbi:MFS transporter [Streptomyces sp. NPDC058231]|uniref:MFS transporter n=1 Tax=Streptomyces sp. NPDC058231 TaxID=3346392 RepID=UPI0036E48C20
MTSIPEVTPSVSPPPSPSPYRELIGVRLDRLPHGRFRTLVMICSCVAFIFEIGDQGAMGITASTIREHFGTNLTGVAFAVSAMYLGLLVGSLVAGQSDRFGRRALLSWGMGGMAVFSGLSAASTSLVMFVGMRLLAGIGLGVTYITLIVYISEVIPARRRAMVIGMGVGCGTLGNIGLTHLGEAVVPGSENGWRLIFLMGLIGLAAVPLFHRLPESPRWLSAQGRDGEAEAIVRKLENEAESRRGAPLPPPVPPLEVTKNSIAPADDTGSLFRGKLLVAIVMSVIIWIGFSVGQQLMNTWSPIILNLRGFTVQESLSMQSTVLIGALLGSVLAMLIGDRLPRRVGIMVFASVAAVSIAVFGLAGNHTVIVLAGATVQFTVGINTALVNTFVAERFPTPLRARGTGFGYSVGRMTNVLAPFTIAAVLEALGYKAAAWGGFLAWGLIAVVVLILGGRRRQAPQDT